jgi:hypothetical protein
MKVEKHGTCITRVRKKEEGVPYNISMSIFWFRRL